MMSDDIIEIKENLARLDVSAVSHKELGEFESRLTDRLTELGDKLEKRIQAAFDRREELRAKEYKAILDRLQAHDRDIVNLSTTVAAHSRELAKQSSFLFGNGKPGLDEVMRSMHQTVKDDHKALIELLDENRKYKHSVNEISSVMQFFLSRGDKFALLLGAIITTSINVRNYLIKADQEFIIWSVMTGLAITAVIAVLFAMYRRTDGKG